MEQMEWFVEHPGLSDSVEFLRPVAHHDRAKFYRDTDIFVATSRFESFGLTVLEALHSGCVTLTGRSLGVLEFEAENPDLVVCNGLTENDIVDGLQRAVETVIGSYIRERYGFICSAYKRIGVVAMAGTARSMKIGFFITARLKSTRLKKKILLDLEGRSVLGHVIERAKRVDGIDDVVVCTSTVAQDRPILDICHKHGCYYFNGSPDDVLNRLLSAATFFDCDYLLLITADNPLFSFEYAQRLVNEIKRDPEVDYLHIDGLPLGYGPLYYSPQGVRSD